RPTKRRVSNCFCSPCIILPRDQVLTLSHWFELTFMAPSLWSGNLRLSLVLIPVRLVPAVSTEEAISFRQIHESSGKPIRYVKGVHDGDHLHRSAGRGNCQRLRVRQR